MKVSPEEFDDIDTLRSGSIGNVVATLAKSVDFPSICPRTSRPWRPFRQRLTVRLTNCHRPVIACSRHQRFTTVCTSQPRPSLWSGVTHGAVTHRDRRGPRCRLGFAGRFWIPTIPSCFSTLNLGPNRSGKAVISKIELHDPSPPGVQGEAVDRSGGTSPHNQGIR